MTAALRSGKSNTDIGGVHNIIRSGLFTGSCQWGKKLTVEAVGRHYILGINTGDAGQESGSDDNSDDEDIDVWIAKDPGFIILSVLRT